MRRHRVHKALRLLCLCIVSGSLLAGCATSPIPGGSPERRAERLAMTGQNEDAAAEYIGLAAEAEGAERQRLTLLAVEQWLEAGDARRARNALRRMPVPQSGELLWLWSSNAAALALWEGRADDALTLIEPLLQQPLDEYRRLQVEALHADAWFQKGDPIRALELYRLREARLTDPRAVEQNRQRLWAGLLVTRPRLLDAALDMSDDPEIRGWLSLGLLATSTGQQGIGWSTGARRWLESHPTHPGAALLDRMDLPEAGATDLPRQIALLLPLTGNAGAAGRAVQHGFLAAYFRSAGELGLDQRIRVYDTRDGAARAYREAVDDGAAFVVGPLLRPDVIELATESLLPVPLLTLNYLPDSAMAPPAMYQFGLAPEDEAIAAAERALADGHRHALALVPRNDWGRRLAGAFASAFESGGGTVLEVRDYEGDKQDFSFEIENLLLLSQSVQRYQRLRANLGQPLQFDPRRRQDADFIFLAATAPAGRLLKSQLKFHYAGDLPVYSTSRIFAMDGRSNSDLNGLRFTDTPWLIDPQPWIAELPQRFSETWPDERRLGRLHALGWDAYQLVAPLAMARLDPVADIDGATGLLRLDNDGRVRRAPAWAVFERGNPVPLPLPGNETLPADRPDTDAAESELGVD